MDNSLISMVLGASPKKERYSFMAVQLLKSHGHNVIPVGIKEGSIEGVHIQTQWPSPGSVHTLTIYLHPDNQKQLLPKIRELQPKRVIFNPGAENPHLESALRELGIETVRACTLVMLRTGAYVSV